jgi:hypothetical protein
MVSQRHRCLGCVVWNREHPKHVLITKGPCNPLVSREAYCLPRGLSLVVEQRPPNVQFNAAQELSVQVAFNAGNLTFTAEVDIQMLTSVGIFETITGWGEPNAPVEELAQHPLKLRVFDLANVEGLPGFCTWYSSVAP